jgi:hypothetical protein
MSAAASTSTRAFARDLKGWGSQKRVKKRLALLLPDHIFVEVGANGYSTEP